jgi:hypothetical protein
MKKLLIYGSTAVVLAIIALIVLAVLNLGTLIKTATEEFGPRLTGTEVKLGSADISVMSGSGELNDFYLGNPAGFTAPSAFEVGTIKIRVNKESLTSDRIIIEDVVVLSPHITYEKKGQTDNFQTIINNVKKAVASEEKPSEQTDEPGKEDSSKAIQINHLLIKNASVTVAGGMAKAFGDKGMNIAIPDIEMRNIGADQNTTPAEAMEQILRKLTNNITSSVADMAKQVGQRAQEALQRGSDILKDSTKSGEDAVKGAMEGVKGLFQ